ncbi:MAG: tetratricopeptide repeat protein [Rudaea sp.]
MALAALVALAPDAACNPSAPKPKAQAAHVDVLEACTDPVTLHLRVAGADGDRLADLPTCGLTKDFAASLEGATRLVVGGSRGVLDVELTLRDGKEESTYRASAIAPGVGEVRLTRTSAAGPDVWAWSVRVSARDFIAMDVVNMPASLLAKRIASIKRLQIDHVENFGSHRITFRFGKIPLRSVLELLGEVGDVDVRRIDAAHYSVRHVPATPDLNKLLADARSSVPKIAEAAGERIVALGGNPTRGEDVYQFQFFTLETLAEIAVERKDLDRADSLYRRALVLRDLYDPDGESASNLEMLTAFAGVESLRGKNDEALALLDRAQKAAIASHGEDNEYLAPILLKRATVEHALGHADAEAGLLVQAMAVANPQTQTPLLVGLAKRFLQEGQLARVEELLRRSYPAIRNNNENLEVDTTQEFMRTDDELAQRYMKLRRHKDAEPLRRREIELSAHVWGASHPLTADSIYFLAKNLAYQGRAEEAAAQFERYIEMDRDQPHLGLFRIQATGFLTSIRFGAKDYRAAARWWQEMIALRLKLLGSNDASVIIALRELAILDALAGDEVAAKAAGARALAFEQGAHPQAAVANFADEYTDLAIVRESQLMPELAQSVRWLPAYAENPSASSLATGELVARALEDYSETQMRTAKNNKFAILGDEWALKLRERMRGDTHPATTQVARELADLYEDAGRTDDATSLRAKFQINR